MSTKLVDVSDRDCAGEPDWLRKLKKLWWVNYVPKSATLLVAILAMGGTVLNSCENRSALFINNRAWLGFTETKIEEVEQSFPFRVTFDVYNSGKGPAEVINFVSDGLAWFPITPGLNAYRTIANIDIPREHTVSNRTCKADYPNKDVLTDVTVFPGGHYHHTVSIGGDPNNRQNPNEMIPSLLAGSYSFIMDGCITYKTEETIHHSRFCVIAEPDGHAKLGDIRFSHCNQGNSAD